MLSSSDDDDKEDATSMREKEAVFWSPKQGVYFSYKYRSRHIVRVHSLLGKMSGSVQVWCATLCTLQMI